MSFAGNIGDSMFSSKDHWQSVGNKFSTYDRDHDTYDRNCAEIKKSGWWFAGCSYANLNQASIRWMTWIRPILKAEMKIRPGDHA